MKKFYLGALFVLAIATVHAQPGGGMFGGMPKIDVTFNEYVAAPEGFDKETAGIERGTIVETEYQSKTVGTTRKVSSPLLASRHRWRPQGMDARSAKHHHGQPLCQRQGKTHDYRYA